MLIYCVNNNITGQNYIGQTTKTLTERFEEHCLNGFKLYKSILQYGRDNFSIFQIDSASSKQELNIKEKYWIKKYESTDDTMGLNIQKGSSRLYSTHSDKVKQTIKEKTKQGMFNLSDERKETRKNKSRQTQIDNNIYVKQAEVRKVKYLNSGNPRATQLLIVDKDGVELERFETIKSFIEKYHLNMSVVISKIKTGTSISKGQLKGLFLKTLKPLRTMNRKTKGV